MFLWRNLENIMWIPPHIWCYDIFIVLRKSLFRFSAKRRRIGDDLQGGSKLIKMGNPELTALWNLNPNNMEACKSEARYV